MKQLKKIRDNLLVERIRSGDSEAFGIIYDQYGQKIYRFIYFKVSHQHIAEDINSDVFLKTWEYLKDSHKAIDNLQALIYRIARNSVIDYYRTKNDSYELDESKLHPDEQSDKMFEQIHLNEDIKKLVTQMSQLSDDYNEIITLHYIEDYSIKEVSEILGKTENNTRVTLHRALKSLKNLIDHE